MLLFYYINVFSHTSTDNYNSKVVRYRNGSKFETRFTIFGTPIPNYEGRHFFINLVSACQIEGGAF